MNASGNTMREAAKSYVCFIHQAPDGSGAFPAEHDWWRDGTEEICLRCLRTRQVPAGLPWRQSRLRYDEMQKERDDFVLKLRFMYSFAPLIERLAEIIEEQHPELEHAILLKNIVMLKLVSDAERRPLQARHMPLEPFRIQQVRGKGKKRRGQ